jgi:hypothetical protein
MSPFAPQKEPMSKSNLKEIVAMDHSYSTSNGVVSPDRGMGEPCAASEGTGGINKKFSHAIHAGGRFIGDNPLLCLGLGLLTGMMSGWWIKRK